MPAGGEMHRHDKWAAGIASRGATRFQKRLEREYDASMSREPPQQHEPFEVSRRVWSDPTCMLLVFVGSSAEFPLNPAVDWLFYTGRLPSDPLARFLETVAWLRRLIVADEETRNRDAKKLKKLHEVLEQKRGDTIPALSYRDVLCMNMIYSIRSVPLVTGKELELSEKDAMVRDLSLTGQQMGIQDLPWTWEQLCQQRRERIKKWVRNDYTSKLLDSYRQALGPLNYEVLISGFPMLVEDEILERLGTGKRWLSSPMKLSMAPLCRTGLCHLVYRILLPSKVKSTVLNWSKTTQACPMGK